MDGMVTEFVDINRGVPQGAVLDPFLFSLMVDDINPLIPKDNLLIKFADDITVSAPAKENSDTAVVEVNIIDNWAMENRMSLNLFKAWEMVMSEKTPYHPYQPLSPGIGQIERKHWLKLLGTTFQDDPIC